MAITKRRRRVGRPAGTTTKRKTRTTAKRTMAKRSNKRTMARSSGRWA